MAEVQLKFDMKALEKLEASLVRIHTAAVVSGGQGLREFAEEVMDVSYGQVPKVTGTLANSGFVEGPDGLDQRVRFGYGEGMDSVNPDSGQPASQYAVPVHEKLDAKHPNGKAKFLEDPINEKALQLGPSLAPRVAAGIIAVTS